MDAKTATQPRKQRGRHVLGKLTALQVAKLKEPGYHSDGGNLWLRVAKSGSKNWEFIYTLHAKTRTLGLGGLHKVSLERARQKASDARAKLGDGIDPVAERQASQYQNRVAVARRTTFAEVAKAYIKIHTPTWTNPKHAAQWTATIETYANPIIGKLPVEDVDTALVLKVLTPIWTTKTETATRVRQRIEAILDSATVDELREGANPARWKGHLENRLPKPSKVAKVEHHATLPFDQVATFMLALREQSGIAARALEFLILTACRSGEVLGAKWEEIDLKNDAWVIPANRMKAKKEHRVPLNVRSREILFMMKKLSDGTGYVFVGDREGKPLSNMSMTAVMRRMKVDAVPHGFRSSFRDWASEKTTFQREVIEMSLAHTIGDKVEAAYRRGDLFAKRVKLMHAWSDYVYTQRHGNATVIVVPIESRAA